MVSVVMFIRSPHAPLPVVAAEASPLLSGRDPGLSSCLEQLSFPLVKVTSTICFKVCFKNSKTHPDGNGKGEKAFYIIIGDV